MSKSSTPTSVDLVHSPIGRPRLTPEQTDAILADFRQWLAEVADTPPPGEPPPNFSWAKLIEQIVALRHEVQWQLRAVRQQNEHTSQLLQHLAENDQRSPVNSPSASSSSTPLRSLIVSLIDLADIQTRAFGEVERVLQVQDQSSARAANPQATRDRGVWSWIRRQLGHAKDLGGAAPQRAHSPQATGASGGSKPASAALLEGLRLARERIAQILRQNGVEPIAAVGQPFDPETMEVIDVVTSDEAPRNHVVEEIRRGYRWQGQLIRTAQVRVNRGKSTPSEDTP